MAGNVLLSSPLLSRLVNYAWLALPSAGDMLTERAQAPSGVVGEQ